MLWYLGTCTPQAHHHPSLSPPPLKHFCSYLWNCFPHFRGKTMYHISPNMQINLSSRLRLLNKFIPLYVSAAASQPFPQYIYMTWTITRKKSLAMLCGYLKACSVVHVHDYTQLLCIISVFSSHCHIELPAYFFCTFCSVYLFLCPAVFKENQKLFSL